ncbi:MAG TPA: LamG-like jellyroll fold domain-containing protein [Alphaproteobacteria bacterium]|nr:LamG-like jellyroll fold domain-containing protein [Alphaproteobacteria bacterium]
MLDRQVPTALVTVLMMISVTMALTVQAGQVRLSWDPPLTNEDGTPLTDLAGYMLYYGRTSGHLSGSYEFSVDVGTHTTYTLSGLQDGQLYYFSVTAYDTSDNESNYSDEMSAIPSPDPPMPSGLVAAYSFDEGSGTTVADDSGNGHTGTISGGIWTAQGKFSSALVFDGVDDFVTVSDSPRLDLGDQGTIAAWVQLNALGKWHGVIAKGNANTDAVHNYALEITDTNLIRCILGDGTAALRLDASLSPVVGQFYHLACTWDGTTVRLYVNGTLDRSTAQTLTPAGNTAPLFIGQFGGNVDRFDGTIDEVRIYNRALTTNEIQTDMNTPVTPPPGGAPVAAFSGAPTSGAAPLPVAFRDGSSGSITAWSWDFGDGGTSTAQHPSHTYTSPGSYTVSLTVTGPGGADTETKAAYVTVNMPPPVAAFSGTPTSGAAPLPVAFRDGSSGSITAWSWDFGDGATSTAQNPSHTYAAPGSYTVSLTVTGPGGSDSEVKAHYITVSVNSTGLVAAYGFNEGSGTVITDLSGNGNHGTISGAAWTSSGRFGKALTFDGVNDWVTVNDAPSLDLTTGMTLAAWVYPTTNTGWRTIVIKEQSGQLIYALYSSTDSKKPSGHVFVNGKDEILRGPSQLPLNTWTHLATTYNGSVLRLYVNGVQVSSRSVSGSILTSTRPLRIGGNSVWPEWFKGRIDEVRVYNRALSGGEIQADMNTPIQ